MPATLIDAGPIIAFYNAKDHWHQAVVTFLKGFAGQFITTCPVISEAMYNLSPNRLVQNELLADLSKGLYSLMPFNQSDFVRIAELNLKYADLPGDFADLSLVVLAERLNISDIVSLDQDFDVYQRYRKGKFKQLLHRKS
jgi:uncharacterized protein